MRVKYAIVRNESGAVYSSGIAMDIEHVKPIDGMTIVELASDSPIPRPDYDHVDIETGDITDLGKPLSAARLEKADEMRAACAYAIRSAFSSDALGPLCGYPADATDQLNMQRVAAVGGALWCQDSGGWAMLTHSPEQGAAVLYAFGAHCDAQRAKLAEKLAAIDAAEDAATVDAVSW